MPVTHQYSVDKTMQCVTGSHSYFHSNPPVRQYYHTNLFSALFLFIFNYEIYCKNKIIKIVWAVCLFCRETLPVSEFKHSQNCEQTSSVAADSLCDCGIVVPFSGILVSHAIYSSVDVSNVSLHPYHAMKGAW